jgi:next-to-BRCA1 protein 1
MHPDCPDYDLCADCEAHPIPQHPVDHPLLKMKTATTVIPTVYRVGGTTLIPEPAQPISRASSSVRTPVMRSIQTEEPDVVGEDKKSVSEIGNLSDQFSHLLHEEQLIDVDPAPVPIAAPAVASPLGNEALLSAPNVQPQAAPNGDYLSLLRRLQENLQPSSSASVPSPEIMSEAFKPVLQWVTDTRELLSSAAASASAAAEQRRAAAAYEPTQVSPMPGAMPGEVSPISFAPAPLPAMTDAGLSVAPWSVWREPQSAVTAVTEPFIRPESPFVESPIAEVPSTIAPEITMPPVATKVEEVPQVEVAQAEESKPAEVPAPTSPAPLRTAFVSDLNIHDGQVFPPGAEFVKSWILRNDGERAWPEETQLGFVAGERMGAVSRISVGAVAPGAEATVSTPEMKAPDAEGRYVSYWRLFESANGPAFGTSVWVDVTVTETTSGNESGASLASSSIIMPGPSSTAALTTTRGAGSLTTVSDDDVLSVASSMSLIDAPSEIGSERPAPTRANANEGEFVVLYDTALSDED